MHRTSALLDCSLHHMLEGAMACCYVQLFTTCWEKLLLVCRLIDLCLGRVCVGFVACVLERIRLF